LILYFDTFITDKSLVKWEELDNLLNEVRDSNPNYKRQSKINIVKYTLASYSVIKWSNVLIRFQIDDELLVEDFHLYVKNLFPNAKIEFQRSTNQSQYIDAIDYFKTLDDKWIFYAPNNDHPFIANNIEFLENIVDHAEYITKQYETNSVSITYSHFSECMNSCKNKWMYPEDFEIVNEHKDFFLLKFPKGYLIAISIVHIDLFEKWFKNHNYFDKRIVRTEDIIEYSHPEQYVLVPKSEICRHYDSYAHTSLLFKDLRAIPFNIVPPLFIPNGFFDNNIRINCNPNEYIIDCVNINSSAKDYSFKDKLNGTDLMINIEQIPLFWKDRISEVLLVDYPLEVNINEKYIHNPILSYPRFLIIIFYLKYLLINLYRKIK
jgi:hypothetical protein